MMDVNPDFVLTYTIKPNIYGGIAARHVKKQYAVNITGLGSAFEKSGIIKMIVIKLYKHALKKAKVIFFENSSNRDDLVSYGCCAKDKTVVLHGAGVNTEIYTYQQYPYNDTIRFLFIGRVMKEKGIDELIESMKMLIKENIKCFLDVVGPFEEDYKEKLERYEREGWLKYHGYQENVMPFIAACDCFVLPSYHEGMANTNLECASSGRPIITSAIHGCMEAVVKESGLLCEPKNSESLYKAMKKMTELRREDREKMGKAGRDYMIDVFDKKKVIDDTISFL
jgi:galacturonosyltransferase